MLDDGHVTYFYGLGLADAVDQSNGLVRIFHTDGLGSVRAITNRDDRISVIETYQTDAFGIPTQTQGNSAQPFQFTGQQRDASTGLYDLRARMYDPTIGRFMSRDPWPGVIDLPATLSHFTYAENSPGNLADPSGMCAALSAALRDKCETERRKIESLANRQRLRYENLQRDKNRLYVKRPPGRNSWYGHVDRYYQEQEELSIAIAFFEMNCEDRIGPLPESITRWKMQPAPSKPDYAIDYGPRIDSSTVVTDAKIAVGVYIAYRVIRFVPSLTPELWWTIPINAAVP